MAGYFGWSLGFTDDNLNPQDGEFLRKAIADTYYALIDHTHETEAGGGSITVYWDSIVDKPELFPPLAHTHPWSEITGVPPSGEGGGITYNIIRSSPAFVEEFDDFLQNAAAGKLGWTTGNQNGFSLTVPGNGWPGAKGVFGCGINGSNQAIGDFSRNRLGNFPIIPQPSEGYSNLEIYGVIALESVNQTSADWSSRFGLIDAATSNIDGSNSSIMICAEFFNSAYNWVALWRSGSQVTERQVIAPVQVSSTEMFDVTIFIDCTLFKITFSVGANQIEVNIPQSSWNFGAMAPVFQIQRLGISGSSANRRIWGDKFRIRENIVEEQPVEPGDVNWVDIINKPDTAIRWPTWTEVADKPNLDLIYRAIGVPIDYSEIANAPTGISSDWNSITNKPLTFPPSLHTHDWSAISNPPLTATRWPGWTEVTDKPTTFAPSAHTHPWGNITSPPATATRWPAWAEITDKPDGLDYLSVYESGLAINSGGGIHWIYNPDGSSFLQIVDRNVEVMLSIARAAGPGNQYEIQGAAKSPVAAQNYSYGTGWSQYSPTFAATYRRMDKLVVLSGLVARTVTTGTLIATLPAGYRPPATRLFGCQSSQGYTRIDINTSGQVLLTSPNPSAAILWLSLDGISFFVP